MRPLWRLIIPSFEWQFNWDLPSRGYLEHAKEALSKRGLSYSCDQPNSLRFRIPARAMLGFSTASFGSVEVRVLKHENGRFNFRLRNVTQERLFYAFAGFCTVVYLVSVISARDPDAALKGLILFPFLSATGHGHAFLLRALNKAKRFLLSLDE